MYGVSKSVRVRVHTPGKVRIVHATDVVVVVIVVVVVVVVVV